MAMSLEDSLNPEVEVPEVKQAPEPAAEPVVETEEKAESTTVPLEALQEERQKRKDARDRAEALERQVLELSSRVSQALTPKPPAESKPEAPDFYKDPQGFLDHRLSEVTTRLQQDYQDRFLNASEAAARRRYDDGDEALAEFMTMAQKNRGLIAQMQAAPDPGEFAYRTGKHRLELGDATDLEGYRARIEKELREKWEAELSERQEPEEAPGAPLPKSLATARNAGGAQMRKGKVYAGSPSLSDALGGEDPGFRERPK